MAWFKTASTVPEPTPEPRPRIHITEIEVSKVGVAVLEANGSDLSYATYGDHDLYVYEKPEGGHANLIGIIRDKRWDTVTAVEWDVR